MLNLRLTKEIQDKQSKLNNLCNMESNHLSVKRKADIEMEKELLEESLNSKSTLLLQEDKYSVQKFKQATKRLAKKLIAENRIKSRRLGAGPKPLLDSDDEDFIARAIESKSSAHGRRHDSIMYLNHRVTSFPLLSIANYNLIRRGKHMIRSARTVWLRGRPRRVNTIEGKRHCGKWLFCAKKPPKTESELHETTHHQRSHVKVNRESMFTLEDMHNVSLEVSMDDKAYLRPGTDVGFRETKAGKIIDVTDQNRSRKLPQHDFAEPKVYQSPSSYRIMTWKAEEINDLLPNEDAKCYLSDKLTAIQSQFIDALDSYKTCLEEEKLRLHSLMEKLNDCLAVCETIRDKLGNANLQSDLQPSYNILLKNCNEIISLVDSYGLPQMKTVITELTDAGPGVGSSNLEVRFRMAEIARIHSSDRRLRIHRARDDSAQNEVERTNSAIGDALVDGATLTWQRFKAFDGMTEEEIKDMTIEDIKMHKEMIMEKMFAKKFFQDRECLMKYYDVSKTKQKKVPGHAYYDKMQKFMNLHCEQGELYLEYRKRHCIFKQDMMCNFYTDNPPLLEKASEPSPRPYPDYG
ncbi:unnamed protein product [Mytilus coruscus]|uniref:Uncharacterized protein n=1 Tax=Mytilus coruscus TaxID=42192 RepID=A0A6J8BLY3_MYTCO|nr:unnamed protein product [Mytilus coruscus]